MKLKFFLFSSIKPNDSRPTSPHGFSFLVNQNQQLLSNFTGSLSFLFHWN
jgi:hypothetical protein